MLSLKRKDEMETKVYYIYLVLSLKRNAHKPSNVAATNLFSSVYIIDITCIIFILCNNWKTLFFIKVYRYSEGFSSRHIATFFGRSVLKEVRILNYLYSTVTVQC